MILIPASGAIVKQHFGGLLWPLAGWGLHTDATIYIGMITLLANLAVVTLVTLVLKALRISPNQNITRPEDFTADADCEGFDRLDALLDGTPVNTGAHTLR